ncbi:MAG: hypothetical protein CL938_03095 [Deltaproteobacteria bacterium]|nr:hypothetical protein [Deltaproteobacteria bacterium]
MLSLHEMPSNTAAPNIAVAAPTMNRGTSRFRSTRTVHRPRNTGVVFRSRVALATEVLTTAVCQSARSVPKQRPEANAAPAPGRKLDGGVRRSAMKPAIRTNAMAMR